MPRKKKTTFTKIKRGRKGDGKGGCGYGRGGWLGRVVDLEVNVPKSTVEFQSCIRSTTEHASKVIKKVLDIHSCSVCCCDYGYHLKLLCGEYQMGLTKKLTTILKS